MLVFEPVDVTSQDRHSLSPGVAEELTAIFNWENGTASVLKSGVRYTTAKLSPTQAGSTKSRVVAFFEVPGGQDFDCKVQSIWWDVVTQWARPTSTTPGYTPVYRTWKAKPNSFLKKAHAKRPQSRGMKQGLLTQVANKDRDLSHNWPSTF